MTNQTAQKYINKIKELEKRIEILEKTVIQQESTTKNDLGVDYIDKAEFVEKLESETIGLQSWQKSLIYQVMDDCHSVTPQEMSEQERWAKGL